MPATATTMTMTITTKTEVMTAVNDWLTCGVLSGTLDDTGDMADVKVDDETPAISTCLFEHVYKREEGPLYFLLS